jgi:hypothetical protein
MMGRSRRGSFGGFHTVGAIAFIATTTACASDRERELSAPFPFDALSDRCEAALPDASASRPQLVNFPLAVVSRIGNEEQHSLGSIVGVRSLDSRRVAVLDGINSNVSVFDTSGRFASSFGRQGYGPGEFEELGSGHGSRKVYNQIAVAQVGWIAIKDLNLLHVFSQEGRFVGRIETQGARDGPHGVRHIAAVSDSSFLFARTGAMDYEAADSTSRVSLRIYELFVRATTLDTVYRGRIDNTLVRFRRPDPRPPRDPYASMYRRTWDAQSDGLLATVSLRQHGVCFFDGQRELVGAYRLRAPILRVDRGEKRRLLASLKESLGAAPPMGPATWDDLFTEWPRTLPFYTDVVLSPGGTAWVERPISASEKVVDLFHARRGYLGTMQVPEPRLPIAFHGKCALFEAMETHAEAFYGIRMSCPP